MKFSRIQSLKWARLLENPPPFVKRKGKYTSAQVKGLSYERRIVRLLEMELFESAEVLHGPWIQYKDRNGTKHAQPDVLIIPNNDDAPLVIVEVKLTWKTGAKSKLGRVYYPLIKRLFPGFKIKTVQIFQRKPPKCGKLVLTPIEALLSKKPSHIAIQLL